MTDQEFYLTIALLALGLLVLVKLFMMRHTIMKRVRNKELVRKANAHHHKMKPPPTIWRK